MKKNRFKIFTSLFACLGLCICSSFLLFSSKKNKTEKVSAVDYQVLYSTTFTMTAKTYKQVSGQYSSKMLFGNYVWTFEYCRLFDGNASGYCYHLQGKYLIQFDSSTDFYLFGGTSFGSVMTFDAYSGRFLNHLSVDDVVSVSLNQVDVTIRGVGNEGYSRLKFNFNSPVGTVSCEGSSLYYAYYDANTPVTAEDLLLNASKIDADSLNVVFDSFSVYFDTNDYDTGYQDGYNGGFNDGYNQGYDNGYGSGYQNGYDSGYATALGDAQQEIDSAYSDGYSVGWQEGFDADSTAITIMSGIFQVALVPINFFLGMFNFEILGINLARVIQAIFTISMTIIIVKVVVGRKGD